MGCPRRLKTHTLQCAVCSRAYRGLLRLRALAAAAAAVLFFAACAAAAGRGLSPAAASLGLLAAGALAAREWAARTAQLFVFKDYDHAHPSKR